MLLEKGGKSMEIHKADITQVQEDYFLELKLPENTLIIPITQDVPREIQKVFNKLIVALKSGAFNFELEEKDDGDIIYHVVTEYISQLNAELEDIFQELCEHGLVDKTEND
ncbi:MAG: hypothetical protein ABW104_16165 [Candidatus Thiodiazotropha sp. 6PLUC2]|nr:hypothetical protein [Candidatus Thiodiazotropha lotti]MCW4218783.1 hypothetical protein [Candidatus Thiodiazotropha lotti]